MASSRKRRTETYDACGLVEALSLFLGLTSLGEQLVEKLAAAVVVDQLILVKVVGRSSAEVVLVRTGSIVPVLVEHMDLKAFSRFGIEMPEVAAIS